MSHDASADATDTTADTDEHESGEEGGGKGRRSPDQKLVRVVARTLWSLEFKERSPGATSEQRKEAWNAAKKDASSRARKFLRKLEAKDITFTLGGAQVGSGGGSGGGDDSD
jgi:hypothetical protein